jgi:hypothetical protein
MEEKDFYFILVCAFFYEVNNNMFGLCICWCNDDEGEIVEENVLEKTKGNAWM